MCTSCELGNYLFDSNCSSDCPEGYYKAANFECKSCVVGCISCQHRFICDACDNDNGYSVFMYEGKKICIKSTDCFSPCATCSSQKNPTSCSSCITNYNLVGDKC